MLTGAPCTHVPVRTCASVCVEPDPAHGDLAVSELPGLKESLLVLGEDKSTREPSRGRSVGLPFSGFGGTHRGPVGQGFRSE